MHEFLDDLGIISNRLGQSIDSNSIYIGWNVINRVCPGDSFASLGLVLAVGYRYLLVHISNTIHRSSQSYFMNRVSFVLKDAGQPVDDLEVVYLKSGRWLVG
jgi:hypothetical protein